MLVWSEVFLGKPGMLQHLSQGNTNPLHDALLKHHSLALSFDDLASVGVGLAARVQPATKAFVKRRGFSAAGTAPNHVAAIRVLMDCLAFKQFLPREHVQAAADVYRAWSARAATGEAVKASDLLAKFEKQLGRDAAHDFLSNVSRYHDEELVPLVDRIEASDEFKRHLARAEDPNRPNVSLTKECGLGAVKKAASLSFIALTKNVLLVEYEKMLAARS